MTDASTPEQARFGSAVTGQRRIKRMHETSTAGQLDRSGRPAGGGACTGDSATPQHASPLRGLVGGGGASVNTVLASSIPLLRYPNPIEAHADAAQGK